MDIFDERGRRLTLSGAGSAGGEGTVYPVIGEPDVAAKIYHPAHATAETQAKLKAMHALPPNDPTWAVRRHRSLSWVKALCYFDPSRSRFAGFLMPYYDPERFLPAHRYYDSPDRIQRFGGAYTWRHLLIAAHNLASAVASVHETGHRVGDLRETNLLVAPNSLIALIDCDSFQILGRDGAIFHTRVGTGEYLPPEMQSSDFRRDPVDRYESDLFALAVLIFKFLMLGTHPFQATGPGVEALSSTEAKIRAGSFPYRGAGKSIRPPEFSPDYRILPPSLRLLFQRAFRLGHQDPSVRPHAREWSEALALEGPALRRCKINPHHAYGGHLRGCPWCAFGKKRMDPFPSTVSIGGQLESEHPADAPSIAQRREHLKAHVQTALTDGDISPEEDAHLKDLAARAGLRRSEVDRLVASERKTRVSVVADSSHMAAAASSSETVQTSPRLSRLMAELGIRPKSNYPRLLGSLRRVAPLLLTLAAAAVVAPIPALIASVLVLAPAMALWGQFGGQRWATTKALRTAAAVPPRALQNVAQSIYYLVPAALWFALAAIVPTMVGMRFTSLPTAPMVQVLAAAGVIWWVIFTMSLAKGPTGDAFLEGVRMAGRRAIVWAQAGGELSRELILWTAAVAALLLSTATDPVWWPLTGPPSD